ncbi:MAG: glycosyltransferase family 4 protein [Chloroflexota bacterium]
MVVHSFYPDDPRVRRETEALLGDGWQVDVICLRGEGEAKHEDYNGAQVYRLAVRRHRGAGFAIYMLEYMHFFVLASTLLARLQIKKRFNVVQVHNMPDFLIYTAAIPKMLGAQLVLDIHDLVPELYGSKFGGKPGHPAIRMARWTERRSGAFASQVLTAGEPFRKRLVERGTPSDKVTVIMNAADPSLFQAGQHDKARAETGKAVKDSFVLMYHGGLFDRYGLDIAIKAVDRLRSQIPGIALHIYGQGEASADLARLVNNLGLHEHVLLGGFVPIDEIPALVAAADLGVVPYRQNPFTDLLYPTKAFEYIIMGVPVVMSSTGAVVELFPDLPDMFVPPEDVDALAARILDLYRDPRRLQALLEAAQRAYAPYAWENQRERYLAVMRGLLPSARRVTHLERN